jgi:hypothetical protein
MRLVYMETWWHRDKALPDFRNLLGAVWSFTNL